MLRGRRRIIRVSTNKCPVWTKQGLPHDPGDLMKKIPLDTNRTQWRYWPVSTIRIGSEGGGPRPESDSEDQLSASHFWSITRIDVITSLL